MNDDKRFLHAECTNIRDLAELLANPPFDDSDAVRSKLVGFTRICLPNGASIFTLIWERV